MPTDDIRWLDESDDWRTIHPEDRCVLKRGFFMGGATVVNDQYAHKYGKYRDLDVIKELAPEFLLSLIGPMNAVVMGADRFQEVIDNIDKEIDWTGEKLEVYTFEFFNTVFWVANHIPDAPEMSFEMVADHSLCTKTHCVNEE